MLTQLEKDAQVVRTNTPLASKRFLDTLSGHPSGSLIMSPAILGEFIGDIYIAMKPYPSAAGMTMLGHSLGQTLLQLGLTSKELWQSEQGLWYFGSSQFFHALGSALDGQDEGDMSAWVQYLGPNWTTLTAAVVPPFSAYLAQIAAKKH
jgi:hypothetical protein